MIYVTRLSPSPPPPTTTLVGCAVCSSGYGGGVANSCHQCSDGFKGAMYFVSSVAGVMILTFGVLVVVFLVRDWTQGLTAVATPLRVQ